MTRRARFRMIVSSAGVLALAVLLLTGCSQTPSGTTTTMPTGQHMTTPSSSPSMGSRGHQMMPEDIPLFQHAVLQGQQATTLNGHPATMWRYLITTTDVTTEHVLGFYQRQMPARDWATMQVPMETMRGLYGNSAMAYQHDEHLCSIAAGSPASNPHHVELFITVTN